VTQELRPFNEWDRGNIVAVATVADVGLTEHVMRVEEFKWWDVYNYPDGTRWYNSAADFSVRFSRMKRLAKPVPAVGFQAPFAHAKDEVVQEVIKRNPELKTYLT
jgi:hypothetical protein